MSSFRPYRWTGDIFVDTSLRTILALRQHAKDKNDFTRPPTQNEQPEDLTLEDLRILWENLPLARIHSLFKSYMMLFTNNGPLHQSAYAKTKDEQGETIGHRIYRALLETWLETLEEDRQGTHLCEACGQHCQNRFSQSYAQACLRAGAEPPDPQEVSRVWFPLLGTLASDAQSFSGARRPIAICLSCLFALQFLPLGVYLFRGKIALPESPEPQLCDALIRNNVHENLNRFAANEADTLGKGENAHQALQRLLSIFRDLRDINEDASFSLWQISNSTQAAECQRTDLPSRAFSFLMRADKNYPDDLRSLLGNDTKQGNFLDAILAPRDFAPFYPSKKSNGVSIRFYKAYHRALLGCPEAYLDLCLSAALLCRALATEGEKKLLSKTDAHQGANRLHYAAMLRRVLKQATRQGRWSAESYAYLFAFDLAHFPLRARLPASTIYKRIHFFYLKSQMENEREDLPLEAAAEDWLEAAESLRTEALSALRETYTEPLTQPQTLDLSSSPFDDLELADALRSISWETSPATTILRGLASLARLRFGQRLTQEIEGLSRSQTGFFSLSWLEQIFLWPDLRVLLMPTHYLAWLWEPKEGELQPRGWLALLTFLLHEPSTAQEPTQDETFLQTWQPNDDEKRGEQAIQELGYPPISRFCELFLQRFLSRRGHLGRFEREQLRDLRTRRVRLSPAFIEGWLERFTKHATTEDERKAIPSQKAIVGFSEEPRSIFQHLRFLLLSLSCFYREARRQELGAGWQEITQKPSDSSDADDDTLLPNADHDGDDAETIDFFSSISPQERDTES